MSRRRLLLTIVVLCAASIAIRAADDLDFSRFSNYLDALRTQAGIPGLAVCSFCAFTRFVRYMKLYARIKQGLPPPKSYKEGTTTSRDIDGARDASRP